LIPLVVVSFGVSVGACALAAAQAKLPRQKRRFWSRPLVALLFFLQPIVRGWARFKWRLNLLAGQTQILIDSRAPAAAAPTPETHVYWTASALDRFGFLHRVLSALAQAGWTFKTDTGWTTCDVEIPSDVWTRLTLATVSEELGQGKKTFRCRIRSFWSLPAKILFWAVAGVAVLLITFFAAVVPWCWMSLIALPLVSWIFDERSQDYERAFAKVLDTVAVEQALVKLNPLSPPPKVPAA
jgi:hypothetical protein